MGVYLVVTNSAHRGSCQLASKMPANLDTNDGIARLGCGRLIPFGDHEHNAEYRHVLTSRFLGKNFKPLPMYRVRGPYGANCSNFQV